MIIDEKNNVAATDFRDHIDMIRYRFNEILKSLYSSSYKEKDHLPSLDAIYKEVYINNRGFDDTLFRHITFPVFLSILIDTDINDIENYQRDKSPIFNTNMRYMNDFQSLELVRLWLEEIIYTYLHSTAWFTKDMLIDILKQFKNIYHGRYEYIIDFADQFIELESKIYDLEEFKDLKLGQADRHIRYVSEEFSKFILSRSYRKSVRQFNDYMTSYNYINKIFDLSLDNEEKEQPITEYASCFDYDNIEVEDSKADETDNITDIIAPADGIIENHYSNCKIIQVRFDEEINPKELSSDFIDNRPGKRFILNYNRMPTIINDKTNKNLTFSILDQSTPSEIKTGYRFKKGDILIKRSLSSEISQKEIEAITKALYPPINSECEESISNESN